MVRGSSARAREHTTLVRMRAKDLLSAIKYMVLFTVLCEGDLALAQYQTLKIFKNQQNLQSS